MNSPFSINSSNRKIDPTRRRPSKPDGSLDENDRVEIGPTQIAFDEWAELGLQAPHLDTMRQYRLDRIVAEINKRDLAGLLCFDPLNIRYITDTTNMQLWTTHNFARACFVSAGGHVILWDFHNCEHLSAHLPLVKELRGGASFFYFESGDRVEEHAGIFANQIEDVLQTHCGSNRRLAVDKIEVAGYRALSAKGITISDGQEVTEFARVIKGEDDIKAMRCAMASCEKSVMIMKDALYAGQSENDVWAVLHAENIRRGGEWIETRIASSGPRTNPWFQESGPRVIQEGDLYAFDTDLIGVYGICCDISRTWICGDADPLPEQKDIYKIAYDHIMYNMELLKPGVTFREITEKAHRLPEAYRHQRYGVVMHGVGLCDEFPSIRYPEDMEHHGYDGVLEPGMALCVEAYVGAVGSPHGVKLEDQVIITENGYENLTTLPFEEKFLT